MTEIVLTMHESCIVVDSQNLSLILHRYFNPYILPIISDVHGVDLSIWLQISVRPLLSLFLTLIEEVLLN